MNTRQLRKQQLKGMDVVPSTRPIGQPAAQHLPRTKFDPLPWVSGGYRYSSGELTTAPHVTTAAELAEQRYVTTIGDATDRLYRTQTPA